MTISLERGLRHMAWANQKVYESLETLPHEAFASFIVNPEWTAYEISFHICESAGFYVYRLGIGDRPEKIEEPAKISTLKNLLAQHDANLITAAQQEDRQIEFNREGKTWMGAPGPGSSGPCHCCSRASPSAAGWHGAA